jgi:hypothetical protein
MQTNTILIVFFLGYVAYAAAAGTDELCNMSVAEVRNDAAIPN